MTHDDISAPFDFDVWEQAENQKEESKTPIFDSFVSNHVEALRNGKLKSIDIGWDRLRLTKWLQGGTVTMICAKPATGKTWFTHDLAIRAHDIGFKVANIQLEEDVNYHLSRLIRNQLRIDLTDVDNITEEKLQAINAYADRIQKLGETIVIPEGKATLQSIASLIKYKSALGFELIIVDSISVAEKSSRPWEDDQEFINAVKEVALQYKTRVILITHPNGEVKGKPTLNHIAGGKAYQRLCQTVLWLDFFSDDTLGFGFCGGNRVITMLKGRNSSDLQSNSIIFDFKNGKFTETDYVKGE